MLPDPRRRRPAAARPCLQPRAVRRGARARAPGRRPDDPVPDGPLRPRAARRRGRAPDDGDRCELSDHRPAERRVRDPHRPRSARACRRRRNPVERAGPHDDDDPGVHGHPRPARRRGPVRAARTRFQARPRRDRERTAGRGRRGCRSVRGAAALVVRRTPGDRARDRRGRPRRGRRAPDRDHPRPPHLEPARPRGRAGALRARRCAHRPRARARGRRAPAPR